MVAQNTLRVAEEYEVFLINISNLTPAIDGNKCPELILINSERARRILSYHLVYVLTIANTKYVIKNTLEQLQLFSNFLL